MFLRALDVHLRREVLAAFAFDPDVGRGCIDVSATRGVVTVTGTLNSEQERLAAVTAARRVRGVCAVIDRIAVRVHQSGIGDHEVAAEAALAFARDLRLPRGAIGVRVEEGWVTLSGAVAWKFQCVAAERDVRRLAGVRGVCNNIVVRAG